MTTGNTTPPPVVRAGVFHLGGIPVQNPLKGKVTDEAKKPLEVQFKADPNAELTPFAEKLIDQVNNEALKRLLIAEAKKEPTLIRSVKALDVKAAADEDVVKTESLCSKATRMTVKATAYAVGTAALTLLSTIGYLFATLNDEQKHLLMTEGRIN